MVWFIAELVKILRMLGIFIYNTQFFLLIHPTITARYLEMKILPVPVLSW